MLNNVTQIPTTYTKKVGKVNNVSTLDAEEWNNLSTAVQDAHEKINDIIANGKVKDLEATSDDSINISTEGIKDSQMSHEGEINIVTTGSTIELNSKNLEEVTDGNCDIILRAENGADVVIYGQKLKASADTHINGNLNVTGNLQHTTISPGSGGQMVSTTESCSIADIITVVNYFKTNNTTGPFASA